MDFIAEIIFSNAEAAPWIIFSLFLLAGVNVPISEDLMIIVSGVLAASVDPSLGIQIYFAALLGAYFSDWEAYWIGRFLGPKIVRIRWFSKILSEARLLKINDFYRRFGFLTLLFGRFIPFGIRNCLFMTAGVGKMNFFNFIISDGIACLISTNAIFYFSYSCGKNYEGIYSYISKWNTFLVIPLFLFIGGVVFLFYYKKRKKGGTIDL